MHVETTQAWGAAGQSIAVSHGRSELDGPPGPPPRVAHPTTMSERIDERSDERSDGRSDAQSDEKSDEKRARTSIDMRGAWEAAPHAFITQRRA
jgi:hypothetical protein